MNALETNYLTRLRPGLLGRVPETDPSPLKGRSFELTRRDETCERGYRWWARLDDGREELFCFQLQMTREDYEKVFGKAEE